MKSRYLDNVLEECVGISNDKNEVNLPTPGKKRKVSNPGKWKVNILKHKGNTGQSYINRLNNIQPAKKNITSVRRKQMRYKVQQTIYGCRKKRYI